MEARGGRRVPVPLPRRGRPPRGGLCPPRPGEERGPRRRSGSWIPLAAASPRSPSPPVLRGAGPASCPPWEPSAGSLEGSGAGFLGPRTGGPGRGRGARGPAGGCWLAVSEANGKFTASERPAPWGGIFFSLPSLCSLRLWGNARLGEEGAEGRLPRRVHPERPASVRPGAGGSLFLPRLGAQRWEKGAPVRCARGGFPAARAPGGGTPTQRQPLPGCG